MQPESETTATIVFPLPPDFSGEIQKPIRYMDFIAEAIENRTPDRDGSDATHEHGVTLTIDEAETFCWMLRDAASVIHQMEQAFYGDDSWNKVWWENRAKLETCGIKIPYWLEIKNRK